MLVVLNNPPPPPPPLQKGKRRKQWQLRRQQSWLLQQQLPVRGHKREDLPLQDRYSEKKRPRFLLQMLACWVYSRAKNHRIISHQSRLLKLRRRLIRSRR